MGPHPVTAKAASADCNHRISQRQILAACRLFGGWWYQDVANMVKVPLQNEKNAFEILGQLFVIPMRALSLLEKMRIGDIFPQTLKVKIAAWLRKYLIWRAEWEQLLDISPIPKEDQSQMLLTNQWFLPAPLFQKEVVPLISTLPLNFNQIVYFL